MVAVPKKVELEDTGKTVKLAGQYEAPQHVMTYECGSGAFPSFGELALMTAAPRAATVVANTAGRLWTLERKAFRLVVMKTPANELKKTLRKPVFFLFDLAPRGATLSDPFSFDSAHCQYCVYPSGIWVMTVEK